MAQAPPKKGSGLGRKVGPLPLWAWVLGGLALAYLAYRFATGRAGSSGSSQQTQTVASQTPDTATGLAPSAGAPSDTGQTTSDLMSALGGQSASLLSAIEAVNQDVISLAASQIAAAQGSPQISPSSTSETQAVLGTQPGGTNAPNVYYISPQALAPIASQPAPAQSNVVPLTRTTAATRYFTYKRDVPLASGQTVHFLSGRGYYAA